MQFGFTPLVGARLFKAALAGLILTWGAGAAQSATLARPQSPGPGRADAHVFDPAPPPSTHGDPGDMLFGRPPADTRSPTMPRLARFRVDTGDTFVLEITGGGPAYLKYDDSGEVWVLNPTMGPRGDTIYKNDVGQAMLRATQGGGLTVFTQDQPAGVAAGLEGTASDLHNMISGPIAVLHVLVQASARTSQAVGHRVDFAAGCLAAPRDRVCADDVNPTTEGVFADAANLAAQAFMRVEHLGRAGHEALARYDRVALFNGHPPSVSVVGDEVRIVVTPELGFAGRPSSQRISQVLFRR